ncbi:MAG TPA: hypothetical protein V6C86_00125 [Oculatellaceae cyanobacterium]
MDTLSITIQSTILFAIGFVAYALLYELWSQMADRKALASAKAAAVNLPIFAEIASSKLVYLPAQKRNNVA